MIEELFALGLRNPKLRAGLDTLHEVDDVTYGATAREEVWRDGKVAPPGWALVTVFWIALAAGVLLKGLVIVMIVGLTVATLSIVDRSVRWLFTLRPLYGVVWLVVLALPWFIAIYARTGGTFLVNSVIHDTLGKIADAQESHWGPPGYYLISFFATFFPGSILVGLAAPAVWARR